MKKTFILILLFGPIVFGQEINFFPQGFNVKPFFANTLEPRLGFLFKAKGDELRLDIGNSVDLASVKSDFGVVTLGADMFTWTLLRKENNFHFPVDAVDYFFGINFTYKKAVHNYAFGARLRISHISAHMVDGHFDKINNLWMNGQLPRVYSREFIEFMPFYQYNDLRLYAGLTYLYHTDPVVSKKLNYQVGFDYYRKDFIANNLSPFFAYDFKITKAIKDNPNNSFSAGVKFGNPQGKGFSIYYHYYSGMSIQGEYYDYKEKYSGIGFNIDF